MRFTRALVKPPSDAFAAGLTTAGLGAPNLALARQQHEAYGAALAAAGVEVIRLPADAHPDSTFVEDTAVLTKNLAVITRPGAASRRPETSAIRTALTKHYSSLATIEAPRTVDGGDICQADEHFFLGVSERTNEAGAAALAAILQGQGFSATVVDIRRTPGLLHLKSGLTYLGRRCFAVSEPLRDRPELADYDKLVVEEDGGYAANCVVANGQVLVPAGAPVFATALRRRELDVVVLDVSEFRKMDGGLSCLSLRFGS